MNRVELTTVVENLFGKSMMITQDWSEEEILALLEVVERFEILDREGALPVLHPNELAYAVFFDNSTRTKSAWAGAASRLGMRPVIVDGSSTQVEHGETAEETGAMLGMNAHAMGIRHDLILGQGNSFIRSIKAGIDQYLSDTKNARKVPIVNLQCDIDHPTQALSDLAWLQENFGDIRGKNITVSWAYSPSYAKPLSVPQGLIMLLTRFGANITLAHPKGYELMDSCVETAKKNAKKSDGNFRITHDMNDAFKNADVVYPKSWGPIALMYDRVEAAGDKKAMAAVEAKMLDQNKQFTDWICDEKRMKLTGSNEKNRALYMHCLPADIGDEVSASVMKDHKLNVSRQANKKLYVIMALLAVAKKKELISELF